MPSKSFPKILALFQKRVDGDDTILELAKKGFREANIGAEFYAETADEMDWLSGFNPSTDSNAVVHLSRDINLLDKSSIELILNFANRYKEKIYGFVIHDQNEIVTCFDEYISAINRIESQLKKINACPLLFIEYATGLNPERFVELFEYIHDIRFVSACIDIGHVGLWKARDTYFKKHPGEDVCSFTKDIPHLQQVVSDIESAVYSVLPEVINVIKKLGKLGKPVHFHLHDGHPISKLKPHMISDHLSFFEAIQIPFEYKGRYSLNTMFGPSGLAEIVRESMNYIKPNLISYTLEIHPTERRIPLGENSYLFNHWVDKTNAEIMNHWISVLLENQQLLIKNIYK